MAKTIWNEGRVVGYSAYEVYVKEHLSTDPDTPPASEREWLASSISLGSSMILQIPKESTIIADGPHYKDFALPNNSRLCAANTIIGSWFHGNAHIARGTSWADYVENYGPELQNDSSKSPSGHVTSNQMTSVPTSDCKEWIDSKIEELKEYAKIIDGVVIQPGTWKDSGLNAPKSDFSPDFSEQPTVRLFFTGRIETPVQILLSGFTIRSVISGVSGSDSSVHTDSPQDGDFLGPAVYPWAAKILFSVPPAYVDLLDTSFARRSPIDVTDRESVEKDVNQMPIIDMVDWEPPVAKDTLVDSHIYRITKSDPLDANILMLKSRGRDKVSSPVLYSAKTTNAQTQFPHDVILCPVDTTAPGTVKLFRGETNVKVEALASETSDIPQNTGFYADVNDVLHYMDNQYAQDGAATSRNIVVADTNTILTNDQKAIETPGDPHKNTYVVENKAGSHTTKSLSLAKSDGTLYNLNPPITVGEGPNEKPADAVEIEFSSGSDVNLSQSGATYTAHLKWQDLINMLILQQPARLKLEIPKVEITSTANNYVDITSIFAATCGSGHDDKYICLKRNIVLRKKPAGGNIEESSKINLPNLRLMYRTGSTITQDPEKCTDTITQVNSETSGNEDDKTDGYVSVFLKIEPSNTSLVSRCQIEFRIYLVRTHEEDITKIVNETWSGKWNNYDDHQAEMWIYYRRNNAGDSQYPLIYPVSDDNIPKLGQNGASGEVLRLFKENLATTRPLGIDGKPVSGYPYTSDAVAGQESMLVTQAFNEVLGKTLNVDSSSSFGNMSLRFSATAHVSGGYLGESRRTVADMYLTDTSSIEGTGDNMSYGSYIGNDTISLVKELNDGGNITKLTVVTKDIFSQIKAKDSSFNTTQFDFNSSTETELLTGRHEWSNNHSCNNFTWSISGRGSFVS